MRLLLRLAVPVITDITSANEWDGGLYLWSISLPAVARYPLQ